MKSQLLSSLFLTTFLLANHSYGFEIGQNLNPVIENTIFIELNDENFLNQINSWGIPVTNQKNIRSNLLTLITKIEPLFKNLPDTVSTKNGIELAGENAKHYSILKNMFLNANGETDLHLILKYYIFTLQHELGDGRSSPVDNRILSSLGESIEDTEKYFLEFINFSLKNKILIEINYKPSIYSGEKDSHYNRAKLYSLINNAPFILSVPKSYNGGIFNKSNNLLIVNNKFNIEYYNDNKFIDEKTIFNYLYFSNLINHTQQKIDKKIKNNYPMVINDKTIDKHGIFIEKHKYYSKDIYINSRPEDIEGENIKSTVFLQDLNYNINQEDTLVYVLGDYANISTTLAAKNIIIYPLNSSIRIENPNNELNFNNTVIVNNNFVGKIDVENNTEAKALVNIILPDAFKDLFVYEYTKEHLYIKNQRSLFKITKNTILSFKEQNTSFDNLLKQRQDLTSEQMKIQYLIGDHE